MEIYSPKLFLEINKSEYIFAAGDKNEKDDFKLIYKFVTPMQGIKNYKITDLEIVVNTIKKNILIIEQKFNFTFKDIILIIDNLDCSFSNLTGFKKLNGSQILKENITYILNSLKSNIDQTEENKNILHIFNSKYLLDKKKIENLPIGLFGNFYSHELSFCLINYNDYKNLNNIFDNCNLKIKKIILKSFAEGSFLSERNESLNTFFQIKINEYNSQIFYFENDSLKFQQNFSFGSDMIMKDISKITSLKFDIVKNFLNSVNQTTNISKDEIIEKKFFENENYIKIKKKLIFQIAEARIQEFSEIMIIKNINFASYNKKDLTIFFTMSNKSYFKCFKEIYKFFYSNNNNSIIKFKKNISTEDLMNNVYKLVHFGWKKEAIPVTHTEKSIIAKFFDILFS